MEKALSLKVNLAFHGSFYSVCKTGLVLFALVHGMEFDGENLSGCWMGELVDWRYGTNM